jgi:SAM-dependent methyltransferase
MTNQFDQDYFVGGGKSAYSNYMGCKGILDTYAGMLESIFKPTSVFDAGCAYGFVVDWFQGQGRESAGCDISDFAVSHSPHCYVSTLDTIPEPDGKYELVTSTEVLEHIPEDQIKVVLQELARISSKYIVLLVAMFPEGTTHDPGDTTHVTFHPREWWVEQVENLGLKRNTTFEGLLNGHQYSIGMHWNDRFIVAEK